WHPALRGMIDQQVLTSRKASLTSARDKQTGAMGPPTTIPDRANLRLKKSKSTNTLRLPTREEGSKPGYCENCRLKFDDYKEVSGHLMKIHRILNHDSAHSNFEAPQIRNE